MCLWEWCHPWSKHCLRWDSTRQRVKEKWGWIILLGCTVLSSYWLFETSDRRLDPLWQFSVSRKWPFFDMLFGRWRENNTIRRSNGSFYFWFGMMTTPDRYIQTQQQNIFFSRHFCGDVCWQLRVRKVMEWKESKKRTSVYSLCNRFFLLSWQIASVDANDFGMDQQHQPQYEVRSSAISSNTNNNNTGAGSATTATPMNAGMNYTAGSNKQVAQTSGYYTASQAQPAQQSQGMCNPFQQGG